MVEIKVKSNCFSLKLSQLHLFGVYHYYSVHMLGLGEAKRKAWYRKSHDMM